MGYFYELLVALMFSLGGTCVKLIRPFYSPSMITFFRFFVGVLWLLGLKAVRRKRFRGDFPSALRRGWKWLLFGAAVKLASYLAENTALSLGVSYGNILVQPVQLILLTALGAAFLGEAFTARKWSGVALCAAGILLISWNGLSLSELLSGDLRLTLLYVVAGIFAGLFIFAQKKAAEYFDILDGNLCMFVLAAAAGFLFPLARGELLPASPPDFRCVLAILYFGFVTGIGFYLNSLALRMIPFHMVALLQTTMVFFSLLWGILFFHEPVSIWIILGTLLFVVGMLVIQLPGFRRGEPSGKESAPKELK